MSPPESDIGPANAKRRLSEVRVYQLSQDEMSMEQRYQAVLAVVQDGWKVIEVARRVGVSRQTLLRLHKNHSSVAPYFRSAQRPS